MWMNMGMDRGNRSSAVYRRLMPREGKDGCNIELAYGWMRSGMISLAVIHIYHDHNPSRRASPFLPSVTLGLCLQDSSSLYQYFQLRPSREGSNVSCNHLAADMGAAPLLS